MEKCPDCGKEFKSPQALRGHRYFKHGGLSGAPSEGSESNVLGTLPDKPPAGVSPLRQPLSGDQERFRALLQDCDVKKALDTISQTFFAGAPSVIANRYIVVFDHPALGPIIVVGSPVTFGQAEVGPRLPAPELGQHTEEVLLEVGGYSWDEVSELKHLEVI